jgi:hypothetical protein
MHWTDPSGLGADAARVWLGSQAFKFASAFNANIGSWNTASMKTIDSVCALGHRMRVRRVCFMLACVLHSSLENYMCT